MAVIIIEYELFFRINVMTSLNRCGISQLYSYYREKHYCIKLQVNDKVLEKKKKKRYPGGIF